jgi:sigma-B regulation protein RsbU (phosphoserine phosphatase)
VIEEMIFEDHSLTLGVGETLLLASDGLGDIQDLEMNAFGTERVLDIAGGIVGLAAVDAIARVVEAGLAFANGAAPYDDVTVLALRRVS